MAAPAMPMPFAMFPATVPILVTADDTSSLVDPAFSETSSSAWVAPLLSIATVPSSLKSSMLSPFLGRAKAVQYFFGFHHGCFQDFLRRLCRFFGCCSLGLVQKLLVGHIKDLVTPEFPQDFFLCFFVVNHKDFFNEFRESSCPDHLLQQFHWACVPLEQKIQELDVIYLNNLETTPKKSLNSSFLTTSMIISVKVGIGRFLMSSLDIPEICARNR